MAIQKKNGNGNWVYTKDTAVTGPVDAKTTTKILRTKDTFVDADIEIVVNEAAVAEGKLKSVTGNAPVAKVGLNDETYLTTNATGNYGPITATADAASTSKSGVGAVQTSGWINNDATLTVSTPAAAQDSITKYVKAGNLEATVVGDAPVATVGLTDTTYLTTTSTGNFGPITATADAQATSKTGVDAVATAGWIPNDATVTITTPAATRASTTKYVKAGALADATGGEVLATAGFTSASNDYLTDTDTGYAVEATSNAERTAVEVKVKTAGWIPDTASQTSAGMVAEEVKAKKYVKKGELQAGNGSVSATGTGVALGTASTTAPTNGKYISVSGSGSASVKTAGWVADDASLNSKTATKYYSVPGATLSNTEKSGSTYTEITSKDNANVIIPSDGYLYINSGYIDDTKISLATLVPDDATISETATGKSDKMRGISAYDKNGKLIAGSMPDATLATSGTASGTATISTPSYNSTSGKFDQTASGSITGTASASTTATGYATKDSTSATGSVTGSISGYKSLDKITVKATKDVDGKVTPKIKNNTASVTDKTQITSAPSTASTDIDKYYIAVGTDAIDASTTVTPGVSAAGYGDTTNYASAGNVTVTRGAASSGTYYIPVKSGSHDVTKATDGAVKPVIKVDTTNNNASVGTLTTTKPGSGNYVAVNTSAITASTDVTCKTTEGWVETETDGKKVTVTRGASAATTAYVPITGATYTNGTATISGPTYDTTNGWQVSSTGNATVNQTGHTGAKGTSTGTVSGTKNLATVEVQATKGTDGAVKPVIAKDSATTATTGTLTTSKPGSGYYVAVNTSAITGSTTVTPSVKTAGYGDTTNYTSAGNVTVTRGASAADTAYIPVTTATYTAGTATISGPTYNTSTEKFDVSSSGNATVNQQGHTGAKGASTGAVNGSKELNKIAGSVSINGTKTVKPAISKASWTPATNVTDAATSDAATTTAPTSGVYVAVNTEAKTTNVTASATVSTEGYGTASQHGISSSGNVAVGASAADTTYVKIKEGGLSGANGGAVTATAGLADTTYLTTTATGNYGPITATADASAENSSIKVTTEGWLKKDTSATVTGQTATQDSVTKYVKAGSLSNATGGTVTATAGLADTTYLTTDSTAGYGPIIATADASRTAVTVGVGTAGWIPTTASKTSAATDATQDSVTKYVKKGALKSVAGDAPVATASFSSSSCLTDTETSYPITATANAAATSKDSVSAVNTAGWVPSNATVTVTTPKATQATATKYIKAGSLSTSNFKDKTTTGTDLANYTENTSVAVPSGGSLVIEEGYYPKTFITLDQILDGKTDTAGTAAGDVKSGYIAYNVDGQKLTGTLAKLTSSNFTRSSTTLGGSTSATISGPTYNETSGKFDVSSSGSASKSISVTAGKEGWVANGDTVYSGSISSGTISGSKALNKIEIQATKGTDGTVTPVISNIAAATTGNTQVTISPSKTAPTASSDTRYVAVRTVAISGSTTVTPSVKTAGYGDTTNYASAGNVTVTRGSADSGTYYGDLGKPTLTASGSISAVTVGTKSGSTYPITVKTGSASVGVSKAGYALITDSATGTITSTATIPAGGCSCTKGTDGTVQPVIKVDTTNNNASVGTLTTTKPSSGNYIAVNTSAISASTDINCAHTEGWIPAMDATKQLTVTRGASAATTAYIPITAGGHSVAAGANDIKKATVTATTTIKNKAGTAISILTSAPSSGDYIVIGGSATTTAGSLSNTVTCTSTAGYVAAGSKTATVNGSVGVDVTNASNKYIKIYDGALVT